MLSMDRRRFVLTSLASAASLKGLAQAPPANGTTLTLHAGRPGPTIPAGFIGLSYETQQLSEPSFFSPANTGLIAQLRALSPRGVLRLGGNTSDYGFWKPNPASLPPPRARREYKVGDPPPDLSYAVTPEAVHNLRGLLDASGWTCLYGINFGNNTPALAAAEAEFVTQALGSKLEYLQIGNEADRFATTIRDPQLTGKPWNAGTFFDEWLTFANAIVARVPNARFGMPDIASNATWFSTLGDRLANHPIRSHIACLTHHYYIDGPPSNPKMNVDRILHRDPRVAKDAAVVQAAAARLSTSWRMTEGNTCFRGGKPGVSDVFAAALWSADYLLELASLGYAGVNLHGGDGQMVANSLGGKLPGDDLVHDDPAMHPHPYYTPVAHIGDRYILEPVSFGMRFAQQFAGATIIPVDFDPGAVNATAYAARRSAGATLIGIINKDSAQPLTVQLPTAPASLETTSAASLTATDVKVATVAPSRGRTQTVPPATLALFSLPG